MFNEPEKAINEFVRVTKKGGIVAWGDEGFSPNYPNNFRRKMLSKMNPGFIKARQKVPQALTDVKEYEVYDGLAYLAVGKKLSVEAMSLYNHIRSKKDLLDGIVEILLEEMTIPPTTSCWKTDIRNLSNAYRKVIISHQNALPIISTRPVVTSLGLSKVEYAFSILRRGNLSGLQALYTLQTLVAFIIGHALLDVGEIPGMANSSSMPQVFNNPTLLEFPNILSLMPNMALRNSEEEFSYGLELIFASLHT